MALQTEESLKKDHVQRCGQCEGLPKWPSGKESVCQCRRCGFDPWVGKIPWRRKWQPLPVFLPEKSHGQRSLTGYSPWGFKELDTTEQKHKVQVIYSKVVIERDGKGRKRRGQGR